MKASIRARFYAETILGILTGVAFVVTLFYRDWIEVVFKVDPDQGQGWVEWLIVAGLLVVTLALSALARHEWRRAAVVAAA